MKIQFYRKSVYGHTNEYFADPKVAEAFMAITGKKTLTPDIRKGLTMLGDTFEEVLESQTVK